MKVRIHFTKASGAGNDFVIIDARDEALVVDKPMFARAVCSRHHGVGADGLLIIGKSECADFRMEYYNADGTSGAMCGNGGRCVARYALMRGIAGSRVRFESLGSLYEAEVIDDGVRLNMQDPSPIANLPVVQVGGVEFRGFHVDTGAPHAVFFCDQLEELDLEKVGRAIRFSPMLGPAGANIDFATLRETGRLTLRTYERGVEGETLACGTGAVASAVVAHAQRGIKPPVQVIVRSGETLRVHFEVLGGIYSKIVLEGPAAMLYTGTTFFDTASSEISIAF